MDVRLALRVTGNKRSHPHGEGNLIRRPNPHLVEPEFEPIIDLKETPEAHILIADLPGFRREDLRVQIDNWGTLTISGERRVEELITIGWTWHQIERAGHRFRRRLKVPENLNFEGINAKFELGVLYVIMPKLGTTSEVKSVYISDNRPEDPAPSNLPQAQSNEDIGLVQQPASTEEEIPRDLIHQTPEMIQPKDSGAAEIKQAEQEGHIPENSEDFIQDDQQKHITEKKSEASPPATEDQKPPLKEPQDLVDHEPHLNQEKPIEISAHQSEEPKQSEPQLEVQDMDGRKELESSPHIFAEEENASNSGSSQHKIAQPYSGQSPSAKDQYVGGVAEGEDNKVDHVRDSSSTKEHIQASVISKSLFSKRKVVLLSTVIVLSFGLYISYRARSTQD
eukprot:Gb_00079 [translate_table: standard]